MTWLITVILEWLSGKIALIIGALVAKKTREAEIDKESEASVKPLEDATEASDIDKAADDALSGF